MRIDLKITGPSRRMRLASWDMRLLCLVSTLSHPASRNRADLKILRLRMHLQKVPLWLPLLNWTRKYIHLENTTDNVLSTPYCWDVLVLLRVQLHCNVNENVLCLSQHRWGVCGGSPSATPMQSLRGGRQVHQGAAEVYLSFLRVNFAYKSVKSMSSYWWTLC